MISDSVDRGFEHAVAEYAESLVVFRAQRRLSTGWLSRLDHLAVKCLDTEHFDETVRLWLPNAREASYTKLDGRRLVSMHLAGRLALSRRLGSVDWLEIIEPRPERVGLDTVGVDHMECIFPNFAAARAILDDRGLPYQFQSNSSHEWLSIPINHQGQELTLSNRPLADIVAQDLADGTAKPWPKNSLG